MNQRRSTLVLDHTTSFVFNNTQIKIQIFSSTKFSKLYLTLNPPSSTRVRDLRMTEDYFNCLDHMERVVDFINYNGGFTITGWYKRGILNNRFLVTNKINSQNNNNASCQ